MKQAAALESYQGSMLLPVKISTGPGIFVRSNTCGYSIRRPHLAADRRRAGNGVFECAEVAESEVAAAGGFKVDARRSGTRGDSPPAGSTVRDAEINAPIDRIA
jgi:hypothetical protein